MTIPAPVVIPVAVTAPVVRLGLKLCRAVCDGRTVNADDDDKPENSDGYGDDNTAAGVVVDDDGGGNGDSADNDDDDDTADDDNTGDGGSASVRAGGVACRGDGSFEGSVTAGITSIAVSALTMLLFALLLLL